MTKPKRKTDTMKRGDEIRVSDPPTAADDWPTALLPLIKQDEAELEANGKKRAERRNTLLDSLPHITPFELTQTAILLATKHRQKAASEFFPQAWELLIAAARYLQARIRKELSDEFEHTGISFDEIIKSNDKNYPKEKKLLPSITTNEGLIKLIRRYYNAQGRKLTEDEQKRVKWSLGRPFEGEITGFPDPRGEEFIEGRFVPPKELKKIRAWRDKQRQKKGKRAR